MWLGDGWMLERVLRAKKWTTKVHQLTEKSEKKFIMLLNAEISGNEWLKYILLGVKESEVWWFGGFLLIFCCQGDVEDNIVERKSGSFLWIEIEQKKMRRKGSSHYLTADVVLCNQSIYKKKKVVLLRMCRHSLHKGAENVLYEEKFHKVVKFTNLQLGVCYN